MLDGATALALPTKFGQDLVVENGTDNQIHWKSHDADKTIWFDQIITFDSIRNKIFTQNDVIQNTLIEMLHQAFLLNNSFLDASNGYKVSTNLTFPRNWGLGTSSTLINNISQWLAIDAFDLLNKSFGGSGYDIACAQHNTPILYQLENQKPIVKKIDFSPDFAQNIYFVYLNKKQNSRKAIENYRKKIITLQQILEINNLTNQIIDAKNIDSFCAAINYHEELLSQILEIETIKNQLFNDFSGSIKSLGAWGGDFVMVVAENNPEEYFKNKRYQTILKYSEMIL